MANLKVRHLIIKLSYFYVSDLPEQPTNYQAFIIEILKDKITLIYGFEINLITKKTIGIF